MFQYWFAFPAISFPNKSFHMHKCLRLDERFDEPQVLLLRTTPKNDKRKQANSKFYSRSRDFWKAWTASRRPTPTCTSTSRWTPTSSRSWASKKAFAATTATTTTATCESFSAFSTPTRSRHIPAGHCATTWLCWLSNGRCTFLYHIVRFVLQYAVCIINLLDSLLFCLFVNNTSKKLDNERNTLEILSLRDRFSNGRRSISASLLYVVEKIDIDAPDVRISTIGWERNEKSWVSCLYTPLFQLLECFWSLACVLCIQTTASACGRHVQHDEHGEVGRVGRQLEPQADEVAHRAARRLGHDQESKVPAARQRHARLQRGAHSHGLGRQHDHVCGQLQGELLESRSTEFVHLPGLH